MGSNTKQVIEREAFELFARDGYESVSMRKLAAQSGVALSSIYHFFTDKDILLKEIFDNVGIELGHSRKHLPDRPTAKEMLYDRIDFQFHYIDKVVFVLKYYLHYRPDFLRQTTGFLPPKAYLHIDEVIAKGLESGEYESTDPVRDAKIMTHAINGFLLEYFPDPPTGDERTKLVTDITIFLSRSMERKGD